MSIVLRGEKNGVKKETVRTTGVTAKPAHFNSRTGKVTSKDDLHVEKQRMLGSTRR